MPYPVVRPGIGTDPRAEPIRVFDQAPLGAVTVYRVSETVGLGECVLKSVEPMRRRLLKTDLATSTAMTVADSCREVLLRVPNIVATLAGACHNARRVAARFDPSLGPTSPEVRKPIEGALGQTK